MEKLQLVKENTYFLKIYINYKTRKSFGKTLYFLIDNKYINNIPELIKKEFFKNDELIKYFNDNKIYIKVYEVYQSKNIKISNLSNIIEHKDYIKFETKTLIELIKVFGLEKIKMKDYLKKISLLEKDTINLELDSNSFNKEELYKLETFVEQKLKNLLFEFKEETYYNKTFNKYNIKFKLLGLIKLVTIKLLEIHQILENNK